MVLCTFLTLTHFDEDRVAVLLPRLELSDTAHAAAVVLRSPFETLTSVHFPAVQGAAKWRGGHRWWQLGKTLGIKNLSVLFGSWPVVYCFYSLSFVCWTGLTQEFRSEGVLERITPICYLVGTWGIHQRTYKPKYIRIYISTNVHFPFAIPKKIKVGISMFPNWPKTNLIQGIIYMIRDTRLEAPSRLLLPSVFKSSWANHMNWYPCWTVTTIFI